jgi:RimJ/RimL family protein N-acetyltransferase
VTDPTLETDRLFLRELVPEDLAAPHGVLGDPETMRFYPHPFSVDETRMWIDRNRQRIISIIRPGLLPPWTPYPCVPCA